MLFILLGARVGGEEGEEAACFVDGRGVFVMRAMAERKGRRGWKVDGAVGGVCSRVDGLRRHHGGQGAFC